MAGSRSEEQEGPSNASFRCSFFPIPWYSNPCFVTTLDAHAVAAAPSHAQKSFSSRTRAMERENGGRGFGDGQGGQAVGDGCKRRWG